ncbi:MAG TPA: methyltransferase type 12 [Phycisphaerales bacterium]|nr:methyltransferase type 12 [Phycisphaerales bacterium]HCD34910.1 methyltransferase type 12 [Phycisphaerales bacterium]|tara:strand:- start:446 stop:1099 length:654 start_codon:yes stop_codon:yes gene_type:complete
MSQTITPNHAHAMDRMYRFTRHVYDLSRRYYLLGRDRLIAQIDSKPGDLVLEMGCGTARNLIKFNKRHPDRQLFGLDAAAVMLETAEKSLAKHNCEAKLVCEYAEKLDHQNTFGLEEKFDVIFFSYSLSMMPTWPDAIDAALANLKPGGRLYVVDFWDQGKLPGFTAKALQTWLHWFGVHFRPELLDYLQKTAAEKSLNLQVQSVGPRYAYIATITA